MSESSGVLIFILATIMAGLAQVLMKVGVDRAKYNFIVPINPLIFVGYGIMFLTTLMSVYSLKVLPLLFATALLPLSYIFTVFFSCLILKDKISRKSVLAIFVIISGIVVSVL